MVCPCVKHKNKHKTQTTRNVSTYKFKPLQYAHTRFCAKHKNHLETCSNIKANSSITPTNQNTNNIHVSNVKTQNQNQNKQQNTNNTQCFNMCFVFKQQCSPAQTLYDNYTWLKATIRAFWKNKLAKQTTHMVDTLRFETPNSSQAETIHDNYPCLK